MKKKVDLREKVLITVDGMAVRDEQGNAASLGKMFANALYQRDGSKDPLKDVSLAQEIYREGIVELDEADYRYLKDFANGLGWKSGPKVQLLNAFDSATDVKSKKSGSPLEKSDEED